MHLACEIEVLLCFRRSNVVKLNMFAAMAPDFMGYLGMDDTIYNIGCVPTVLLPGRNFALSLSSSTATIPQVAGTS